MELEVLLSKLKVSGDLVLVALGAVLVELKVAASPVVLVPVLVELGVNLAAPEVTPGPAVGLVPASGLGLGLDPVLV